MIDKRLTEEEKKKIKPANQGGGPNYLGKQETVTVPKKWLSSPDHVVAELAYITPREQKILLNADIYGSLKGKPNKGPGGIMSLQGDMGSIGGGSSNDGDNDRPTMADIAGPVSTTSSSPKGYDNDRPTMADIAGPVTSSFTDDDDNRQNYKTDQYVTGPTTTDETTIDKLKTTFAPTVTKPSIWDGIKTFGTNALKAVAVSTGLTALGLSAKTIAIANTALGFGKQTGLTKSGSLGELGLNSLNNIGDMFGNTNDMFGGKNKGNTSTSDINNDIGNRGDGEGIASLQNQTAGYDEYILLLQKLQSGNITDSEKNRFNVLKNMLGI